MAEWRADRRFEARQREADDQRQAEERRTADNAAFEENKARFIEALDHVEQYSLDGARLMEMLAREGTRNRDLSLVDALSSAVHVADIAHALAHNPEAKRKLEAMPASRRAYQIGVWDQHYATIARAQQPAPARPANAPASPSPASPHSHAPASGQPAPQAPHGGGAAPFDANRASFADFEARFNAVRAAAARGNGAG